MITIFLFAILFITPIAIAQEQNSFLSWLKGLFNSDETYVYTPISNSGTATLNKLPLDWYTIKHTGWEYDNLETPVIDKVKQEICIKLKNDSTFSDDLEFKLKSKNESEKEKIKVKVNQNKYCYSYKNKAVNRGEYIQIGNSTIIIVYDDFNEVVYTYDWGDTTFTIYRNDIDNELSDIFVYFNEDKYKFGAYDNSVPNNFTLNNYVYYINSTDKLGLYTEQETINKSYYNWSCHCFYQKEISIVYPVFYNYFNENDYNEKRHIYSFKDVCANSYSNCNWTLNEDSGIITFSSYKRIDPTIENVTGCRTISEPFIYFWNITLGYNNTDINSTANRLMGYYHFDEMSYDGTSGEVIDSMNNINGTSINGANTSSITLTQTAYPLYREVKFNGRNQSINLSTADDSTMLRNNNFAIVFWVNASTIGTNKYQDIIGNRNSSTNTNQGWNIQLNYASSGAISFQAGNGTGKIITAYTSGSIVSANTWQHYVFMRNGNTFSIYRNGVALSVTGSSDSDLVGIGTMDLTLGSSGNQRFFNGSIDELMIFNRSLTTTEITNLYNYGRANWDILPASYKLTQNITTASSTCMVINSHNITLDCDGHTINAGTYAISITSGNNFTLINCKNITGSYGLYSTTNLNDLYIYNNTMRGTGWSLYLSGTINRSVFDSNIFNYRGSIVGGNTYNSNFTNNIISASSYSGDLLTFGSSSGSIKNIISFNNISGGTTTEGYDCVYTSSADNGNVKITNNKLSNCGWGIYATGSNSRYVIEYNNIQNTSSGIASAYYSNITNNTITTCEDKGIVIVLNNVNDNNVTNCNIGLDFSDTSSSQLVDGNYINNCNYGVKFLEGYTGRLSYRITPNNYINGRRTYVNYSLNGYEYDNSNTITPALIFCSGCTNLVIRDLNISSQNYQNLYIHLSNNTQIINTTIQNSKISNTKGLFLEYSTNITLENSSILNSYYAIYFKNTNNSNSNNLIVFNNNISIYFDNSRDNNFSYVKSNLSNIFFTLFESQNNLLRDSMTYSTTSYEINLTRNPSTRTCNDINDGVNNCHEINESTACNSWGVFNCTWWNCRGDYTTCSSVNSSGACTNGCTWYDSSCIGFPSYVDCSGYNYNEAGCIANGNHGGQCSWDSMFSTCSGTVYCSDSDFQNNYSACTSEMCTYNASQCAGEVTGQCSSLTEWDCNGNLLNGCTSSYTCSGSASTSDCSSYNGDEAGCTAYGNHGGQCYWDGSTCSGTVYCSNYYNSNCSSEAGCSWSFVSCSGTRTDLCNNIDVNNCENTGGQCTWYNSCNGELINNPTCTNLSTSYCYASDTNSSCELNWTSYLINQVINISYDNSKELVNIWNQWNKGWWYSSITNYSNGSYIGNSEVRINNLTSYIKSVFTNTTGYTNITDLIEYRNIGGIKYYDNNYTINVTVSSNTLSHLFNFTDNVLYDLFTFPLVVKNQSVTSLTFDKTSPQDYKTLITPTCATVNGTASPVLKLNGNIISSGFALELSAGNHIFNCTYTEDAGYYSSDNGSIFIINKISPTSNMEITGTTPITYLTLSDFAGAETNTGDGDCSYSLDKSNQVYGAGTVTFNYSTTGCTNYTKGSVTRDLIINKATRALLLNSSAGWSGLPNPTFTIIEGLNCTDGIVCKLYQFNTEITNPFNFTFPTGTYTFYYNTTGNENYSQSQVTNNLIIGSGGAVTAKPVCLYSKLGYYNPSLAWIKQDDCDVYTPKVVYAK